MEPVEVVEQNDLDYPLPDEFVVERFQLIFEFVGRFHKPTQRIGGQRLPDPMDPSNGERTPKGPKPDIELDDTPCAVRLGKDRVFVFSVEPRAQAYNAKAQFGHLE
jgi:hypothetical protein